MNASAKRNETVLLVGAIVLSSAIAWAQCRNWTNLGAEWCYPPCSDTALAPTCDCYCTITWCTPPCNTYCVDAEQGFNECEPVQNQESICNYNTYASTCPDGGCGALIDSGSYPSGSYYHNCVCGGGLCPAGG
jgi:hypothetical protein